MEWISVKARQAPKNQPFLALTTARIEMMDWKERIVDGVSQGFYGFYCPCSCCTGYCGDDFELWMPLPEPPKE